MSGDQITEDQNQTKADTFTLNKPVCNSMCVCFQLELQGQEVVVYDQSSSDPASLSPDAFLSVLLAKLEKSFPSVHLLSGESNTSKTSLVLVLTLTAHESVCECVTLTADITQEVNPEMEDVRRVLRLEYVTNCFVCFTVM